MQCKDLKLYYCSFICAQTALPFLPISNAIWVGNRWCSPSYDGSILLKRLFSSRVLQKICIRRSPPMLTPIKWLGSEAPPLPAAESVLYWFSSIFVSELVANCWPMFPISQNAIRHSCMLQDRAIRGRPDSILTHQTIRCNRRRYGGGCIGIVPNVYKREVWVGYMIINPSFV